MVTKITAQSAVLATRQIAHDMERCLHEAGALAGAPGFREDLRHLRRESGERLIDVDVAVREPVQNARAKVSRLLGINEPDEYTGSSISVPNKNGTVGIRLHFWNLRTPPVHRSGSLFRPVLVLFNGGPEAIDDGDLEWLAEDRPLVLGTGCDLPPWASRCWQYEGRPEFAMHLQWLTADPDAAMMELLVACALANGLESLGVAFKLALETELRSLKARKAAIQQRVALAQQRLSVAPAGELTTEIRMQLQRQFGDFQRGCADRMQNLLAPRTGSLSQKVEEELGRVSTLTREKRTRSTALRLTESQENDFLNVLREQLTAHMMADLTTMHDLFRVVRCELAEHIESCGGPPTTPQFSYLGDDRLERLLDTTLIIQRHYQGEAPRTGLFEQFMAARRYLTILFMFLSAFGLSFVRNYRQFMIPVSILLLAGGGLAAIHSARRERAESNERELDKARETLRSELRRLATDVQRGWIALVTQHLSDQSQQVQFQMESSLRDHSARKSAEAADEKQRIQRQLQYLETTEKKLQTSAKSRESAANAIAQVRGELRQLFPIALRKQPVGGPA